MNVRFSQHTPCGVVINPPSVCLKNQCVFRPLLWGNNSLNQTNCVYFSVCVSMYSQVRRCPCAQGWCSCTLQVHPEIYIKKKTHKKTQSETLCKILSTGCKTESSSNIKTRVPVRKFEPFELSGPLLCSFAKSGNFMHHKDTQNCSGRKAVNAVFSHFVNLKRCITWVSPLNLNVVQEYNECLALWCNERCNSPNICIWYLQLHTRGQTHKTLCGQRRAYVFFRLIGLHVRLVL